jgi:hypothetical protein
MTPEWPRGRLWTTATAPNGAGFGTVRERAPSPNFTKQIVSISILFDPVAGDRNRTIAIMPVKVREEREASRPALENRGMAQITPIDVVCPDKVQINEV